MNKKIFKIELKINSLDVMIEKMVLDKLNKNPPESYEKMKQDELDSIYNNVLNSFPKAKTKYFSIQIILSIRANYMREYIITTHKNMLSKEKNIINDYKSGIDIPQLVIKYDASPLNLLRIIFQSKYHKKLTKITKMIQVLNPRDKTQLNWAISHDYYALINQDEILTKSSKFEDKIKHILNKLNIKHKTQNELAEEQIKENNKATITPDFLILDDLYINGFKINWIDAKNFYGSKTKMMISKIKAQTNKYINEWGTGSIVFNLGFNSELKIDNILLINFESLQNIIKK